MHGEVSFEWHEIVHQGEDAFFHFARVFGAEDHHFLGLETDVDGGLGGHARGEAVGGEFPCVINRKIGFSEIFELLLGGSDEHDTHEEGVVGTGADDPDFNPLGGIPSGESIDHVELIACVEIVFGPFTVDSEGVLVDGNINVTPPDMIFGGCIFGDALVTGRAACLCSGVGDECSLGRKTSRGLVADGIHVEPGDGRVANDVLGVETVCGKIDESHAYG